MGNHICTQAPSNNSGFKSLDFHPELFDQGHSKIPPPVEDELLEEFDNPSRGVTDHSFLKTQIEASNRRLISLPNRTFSHQ